MCSGVGAVCPGCKEEAEWAETRRVSESWEYGMSWCVASVSE